MNFILFTMIIFGGFASDEEEYNSLDLIQTRKRSGAIYKTKLANDDDKAEEDDNVFGIDEKPSNMDYDTHQFETGKYIVVYDDTAGTSNPLPKENEIVKNYKKSTIVKIIQIEYIGNKIRGQVAKTLDWVSIIDTVHGYTWLEPILEAIKQKLNEILVENSFDEAQTKLEFAEILIIELYGKWRWSCKPYSTQAILGILKKKGSPLELYQQAQRKVEQLEFEKQKLFEEKIKKLDDAFEFTNIEDINSLLNSFNEEEHDDLLKYLMKPHAYDNDTSLHTLYRNGDIVKSVLSVFNKKDHTKLIEFVMQEGDYKQTPLHKATIGANKQKVEHLLNVFDKEDNEKLIEYLMKEDCYGKNSLTYVLGRDHEDVRGRDEASVNHMLKALNKNKDKNEKLIEWLMEQRAIKFSYYRFLAKKEELFPNTKFDF